MTDELELLLEEQVQEEERPGPRLLMEKRRYQPARKRAAVPGEEGRVEQQTVETVQEEEERFSKAEAGEGKDAGEVGELLRRSVLQKPGAEREPFRQRWGHREEFGAVNAARAAYEELSRIKQAAGYRRPFSGAGVRLMKPSADAARSMQVSVQEIDRLFQRDARRYDGGFVWQ